MEKNTDCQVVQKFVDFLNEIERISKSGHERVQELAFSDPKGGYAEAAGYAHAQLQILADYTKSFRSVNFNK